jgi:DNA-binding SARP family transcriptional activator/tetratricopeptide (TPR) repeat protein
VQLGVLGPLELTSEGVPVALGGPKQRLVLGLLAARRGGIVGLDELIDGLWPDGPQARPRKTIQVYVTRQRRALGEQPDAIRSEAGGYRLDPTLLDVDADAFEAGIREAAAIIDDDRAATLLREALGHWRGDAFGDLRDCLDLLPAAVQLDARRLAAQHELFERVVRRRPHDVLAELEQAVEANPLHEAFAGQLMTAQYLVGRQADALRTFRALRRRLGDELGLEPGPALRDLEGRILRHELTASTPSVVTVGERQRRRVSVVAVAITVTGAGGIDPEVELAIAAPARRAARARLVERGGFVLGASGDELSACFGFPTAERSAERAVLAALAISDLADEQLAVRVGVDTGVVVIEADDASEVSAIAGEPLRAATRLRERAATGEVVLGAATAAAVDTVITTAGRDDLVVAVAPIDEQHGSRGAVGLVAREGAFAELTALATWAPTRFVPIAVSGPAGIGKSALVEHFVQDLDPDAVWLHCDRRYSASPLHPLRPLLPELFGTGDEPGTRAILAALGERFAGRPHPVLVVEDVDSADPSTLDVLDALPDHLATGLVLLTSRAADPVEIGGDIVARIVLGPLDRAASRQMAAAVAGGRRLRLDTLNEIADRSGGVPLHVQALTRALLDADARPTTVPVHLYDSLIAAIDRLGPARGLAQRLAVLGPAFDAREIAYVAAATDVVDAGIEAMLAADVLRRDGDRLRFASALVAETAYDSLLKADRMALHEVVADAMITNGAPPERSAFHLEAAGRPFDAAVAWRRAAADAIRRGRHREAIHHARRALEVLDRLDPAPDGGETRRRVLTALAVAMQGCRYDTAELLAAIADARQAGVGVDDLARRLVLDVMEVAALHEQGDFVAATKVAEQLVDDVRVADDDRLSAFALRFLGACHVWRGQLALGTDELEQAVELAEADADSAVGAHTEGAMWSLLGLAACFADRADEADRLLDRARGVIPADDGYTHCLVAATAAMSDQLADRPATVRAAVEPVWALAMDLGSEFWFAWAQALLGWAVAAEDAPAGLAMMTETVDATTTRQTKPYFLYLLGSRLCEAGRWLEGIGRLDEGLALLAETDERLWEPLLRLTRARWLAAAGDSEAASSEADAARLLAATTGQDLIVRWHDEWRRPE